MPDHPPDPPKGNILVVDDTPANLRLLSQMLVEQGYKVRPAPNGPLALQSAQAAPPDLILLDIKMPEMDGYQVCQRLKADERTQNIPIIFISALGETENKVKAFTAGGVDYITKPFKKEEVLARIETHLALRALQKQLETANQALKERNAELKASNEELEAFAHTVAHDIKNPLGLLIGYGELLQMEHAQMTDEEQDKLLHTFVQSGRKLNRIVEALLLLSSVRKMDQIETQPLDMANILAEAQNRLVDLIEKHRADIRPPQRWPVALGYASWVEEIWVNYLSNALKYGGRPPRIELGATIQEDGFVRFWVRDNGAGIKPEEQARLFIPFERLDQVKLKEGHGLGLSIVRRIVEKHGGQVGLTSQVGRGSTFYFTLPALAPT